MAENRKKFRPVLSPENRWVMGEEEAAGFDTEVAQRSTSPVTMQSIRAEQQARRQEYEDIESKIEDQLQDEFIQSQGGLVKGWRNKWEQYKKSPEYKNRASQVLEEMYPEEPEAEQPATVQERVKKAGSLAEQYGESREDLAALSSPQMQTTPVKPVNISDTAMPEYEALASMSPAAPARPSVKPPEKPLDEATTLSERVKPTAIADTAVSEPKEEPIQTTEEAASDISNTIKNVVQTPSKTTTTEKLRGKGPAASARRPGSEIAYDKYQELQKELSDKASAAIDPEIKRQYIDAQDKARELYDRRENIAAWASLAETIGTGLLKLGMAQTAKQGVDVSKIPWEKPTDVEAKYARYQRQYESDLDRLRKNYLDAKETAETAKGLEVKVAERKAADAKDLYQEALRKEKEERDRALQLQMLKMKLDEDKKQRELAGEKEAKKEALIASRELRAEQRAALEMGRFELQNNADYSQAKDDIKQYTKQYEAFQEVQNSLLSQGDFTAKNVQKLNQRVIQKAALAGIDLNELKEELDAVETFLPGAAGGKTKEQEMAEKRAILNKYEQSYQQAIYGAKQKVEGIEDDIINKYIKQVPKQAEPAPAPTQPKASSRTITKAQLAEYVKQHNMKEEDARAFLANQGYSFED